MSVALGLPASVAISMVGVFLLMNALLGSRYGRWTAKSQQCSHIHRFCAKPQDHAYFIVFIVHFHLYNWEDVPVFVFDLCDWSWTIGLWVESKRSNLRAHFAGLGVPKILVKLLLEGPLQGKWWKWKRTITTYYNYCDHWHSDKGSKELGIMYFHG